ncbi:MAG: FAD-binding protein [Bacteroidetes bacterium]|nr:FAD-binding protein [Bacteroidota bacterium]
MKRKYLWLSVLVFIALLFSVPAYHLLKTKSKETGLPARVPKGYSDDASKLNQTAIDTLIKVETDSAALIKQLRELLQYARQNDLKVSLAGAKHSMGGHTLFPGGIVVNMLPYKHMYLDTLRNILHIGSGALWEDALYFLDQYGRSVAIMQAFSSFSVGGSLSVNGHGWQKDVPPLASSVKAFTLMNADGKILNCSRDENEELFDLVLGGYGLFGIILDVELHVVRNQALRYKYVAVSAKNYLDYYKKMIRENPNVDLVFGRLRISGKGFLDEAILNYFERTSEAIPPMTPKEDQQLESSRLVFRSSVNSEYGKRLRWDLERGMNKLNLNTVFSRNELLNDPVSMIENKDSNSTDILHEYFIPVRNFNAYLGAIKPILKASRIDLLNITIRAVQTDIDSYLNYAREPVFGFVYLFNQLKTPEDEEAMRELTNALTDIAIQLDGTFYLPYRLHVSPNKMRMAYPKADAFFALKRKYDPEERFDNLFYEHYR